MIPLQPDYIMNSLKQLAMDNGDVHWSYDFMMKNFEVRQAMSDEEMESRKAMQALLTGIA